MGRCRLLITQTTQPLREGRTMVGNLIMLTLLATGMCFGWWFEGQLH
jgi:hypothetical protein